MQIVIPNLKSRPDKLGAVKAGFLIQGYPTDDVSIFESHDANAYADIYALIGAMAEAGWISENNWEWDVIKDGILPEFEQECGLVDPMKHLALRWTYLDILDAMTADTLIIFDDMYLPYSPNAYQLYIDKFAAQNGLILGMDTMPSEEQGNVYQVYQGYGSPTEEAVFFTVEGAKQLIPLLISHPSLIIGDVIRLYFPKDKVFKTSRRIVFRIGKKYAWRSNVHKDYGDNQFGSK